MMMMINSSAGPNHWTVTPHECTGAENILWDIDPHGLPWIPKNLNVLGKQNTGATDQRRNVKGQVLQAPHLFEDS